MKWTNLLCSENFVELFPVSHLLSAIKCICCTLKWIIMAHPGIVLHVRFIWAGKPISTRKVFVRCYQFFRNLSFVQVELLKFHMQTWCAPLNWNGRAGGKEEVKRTLVHGCCFAHLRAIIIAIGNSMGSTIYFFSRAAVVCFSNKRVNSHGCMLNPIFHKFIFMY